MYFTNYATTVMAFGIFIIVLTVVIWFYQLWQTRRIRRMIAHLPGPPVYPFLGNSLEFLGSNTDIMACILDLPKKYPPPYRIWLGNKLTIAVTNPAEAQFLLNNSKAFTKYGGYSYLKSIMGDGLFTAPVLVWKRHRKLIAPTFNQKILDTFVEIFVKHSNVLIQQLKKEVGKGTFDVFKYTSACTVDAICETTMGVQVNAQVQQSPFLYWVNSALEIAVKRGLHIWLGPDVIFNLTKYAKIEKDVVGKVRGFVDNVIRQKKEEYQNKVKEEEFDLIDEDPKLNSTLDLMIELSSDGRRFTDEELRNEVNTIVTAGSDTTASTIAFLLIMLGMHPECQEKLYEEAMDVLGPDRNLEQADLKKLVYTERVIKETLRIFPAGPMVSRIAEEDIHLESCTIPATTAYVVHIIGMQRDPAIYPEPMKFDPDRFLPEEAAKRHPYSWIPFGAGPRNCIGLNYGMMQMKAMAACLIRKYKFKTQYNNTESVELTFNLIVKPVHGYLVSVESRE